MGLPQFKLMGLSQPWPWASRYAGSHNRVCFVYVGWFGYLAGWMGTLGLLPGWMDGYLTLGLLPGQMCAFLCLSKDRLHVFECTLPFCYED